MPPEVMTAFLTALLREHFGDPACVVDPIFRDAPWRPHPTEVGRSDPSGGMVVESADAWDPELVEARPALIVADHAYKHVRVGIGGRMEGHHTRDGFLQYGALFDSANTIFCVGRSRLEAKRLGTEVLQLLVQFADAIREAQGLVRFVPVERGDVAVLEESTQNFACPVPIAWQAQMTWEVRRQASVLNRIITKVAAELGRG